MLKKLIEIETAEIGTRETGQNYCKYNDWYWGPGTGGPDYPWCVVFQAWAADQAGVPFPKTAHCNGVESYAKGLGQWVTNDYAVGDFVIFDYEKDGNRDHIGLVVETENGRVKTTIEGNYADAVQRVNRRTDCSIIGAYRPKYENHANAGISEEPAAEPVEDPAPEPSAAAADVVCKLPNLKKGDWGEAVEALQILLRYHRHFGLSGSFIRCTDIPDGEFGPETEFCVESYTGKKEVDAEGWEKIIGGLG